LSRVERIDTYGAWLIERALRIWRSRGCATQITGLSENYRDLFAKVHAGTHAMTPEPPRPNAVIATLESVGRTMTEVGLDTLSLMRMGGALIYALGRVLIHPRTFRITSTVKHLERVAWNAVPIILLMTVLIGAILAQQGIFHFRQFGAAIYVVDMVGVLVLREVGVLIVCIMVAGRSGSAYTAELGSMKMREEIDALRIMGFDPAEVLILPPPPRKPNDSPTGGISLPDRYLKDNESNPFFPQSRGAMDF
jgi:phospholipid/cholesterol/gamma-HCH transport system permease protein